MENKSSANLNHIRRCHICGGVNESEGTPVQECQHCGKHFAPFFYFDEKKLDQDDVTPYNLTTASGYRPLRGFSLYW